MNFPSLSTSMNPSSTVHSTVFVLLLVFSQQCDWISFSDVRNLKKGPFQLTARQTTESCVMAQKGKERPGCFLSLPPPVAKQFFCSLFFPIGKKICRQEKLLEKKGEKLDLGNLIWPLRPLPPEFWVRRAYEGRNSFCCLVQLRRFFCFPFRAKIKAVALSHSVPICSTFRWCRKLDRTKGGAFFFPCVHILTEWRDSFSHLKIDNIVFYFRMKEANLCWMGFYYETSHRA